MDHHDKENIALQVRGKICDAVPSNGGWIEDSPVSAQALLAIDLFRTREKHLLWIAEDVREMEKLTESIQTLKQLDPTAAPSVEVRHFPPAEKDPAALGAHLRLAKRLEEPQPLIIVTCPQALESELPLPGHSKDTVKTVTKGDCLPPKELSEWLEKVGYQFNIEVYQPGDAARRGGILDCWPPGSPRPIRIDFFGDEVDSIRFFDDQTQCSIEPTTEVQFPQLDFETGEYPCCSLFELLPPDAIQINQPLTTKQTPLNPNTTGLSHYDTGLPCVSLSTDPKEAERKRRQFVKERCADAVEWNIHFFFETSGTHTRFVELYDEIDGFERLFLHTGVIHESAADPDQRLIIITESDFYAYHSHRSAHARQARRFKKQERISEAADIQPGDYVVHVEHGIGKYLGIVETTFNERNTEVLAIEYAKGERVYLPVTQAHLLTRYKGMGKHTPKPHSLKGRKWSNDKERAEQSAQDLAAKMLQTQAERHARKGFRFSKDSAMQTEFEAAFPYTETPDQLHAAEELKRDMEKARPMDRLLCGDVGFGKTEVSMRAAFKAVLDRKQVAVLVPTTVLAQQHYETFVERMAAFPVRIDMVSRFRSRAQQNQTLEKVREGEVDILIGTHRLLSKDVQFADLGLLVIDEEQRFGVEDKEQLKQLCRQVDVITMSATPIPRTLYMGMTGVRDLSTIKTAPQERQPVETNVIPYDEEIIREAILMELSREGQVFYLHNRVKSIHLVENRLMALVPEARIAVAHGQMGEKELSDIMHAFVQGRFDVLLCTTIIESGVDIPNCNTMIIENAERFGLSDLYQLRGRVGRSNLKGFAYLLLSPGGEMIDSARERMDAIRRYTGLGSGFRLAIRDLELRGAGNLLGAKQSGHISAVGFDLYCQLLRRSIAILQGKKPPPLMEVHLKLDFITLSPHANDRENGAYIPYAYIEDENLRLRLYQRISALATRPELRQLKQEIKDRFGKLPPEMQRLCTLAELRILAAEKGIQSIVVRNQKVMISRDKGYLTEGSRHPRLFEESASAQLRELRDLLKSV